MRSTVKVAALVAGLFGVVTASSCVESNGNWYCNQVEAVTYLNLGGSGSYNRVSSMNGATGVCNMTTYNYSGTNAPFDEEVRPLLLIRLLICMELTEHHSFPCTSGDPWH